MTVSFTKNATSGTLYYSLDKQEWNELTEQQTINNGEKIYLKGDLVPTSSKGIGTFTISKNCNVAGNVMSLLFRDDFISKTDLTGYDYAFYNLFRNCANIQSAKNLALPATTLAYKCYYYMFYGCTSLTLTPELPATELTEGCYCGMFGGCTSLVTAPELPATTLAEQCYVSMFSYCTSLVTAPELPATTLAKQCYGSMFRNCTSLTTASELPATTFADRCYENMFHSCTSLTSAPELPATTLAYYCYNSMFYNCTKLNNITMLATDISAYNCLYQWTYNVAPTGTFTKHPDMTSLPTGEDGIPSGWTVVDYAA